MMKVYSSVYNTSKDHIFKRSGFCFSFFLTVLLSLFIIPVFNPASTYGATYSASISTSSALSIDASNVGGGTSVGVDNLTVNSTCPSGYNITIEGPSDTNLYLNGDSSNNASGTYIAHSTGTPSNPAVITGANKGTWGYSTTSSTGSGTFIGLTNTATTLVSKGSASASGGDAIPIYYGVSLPDGIAPGTYQMPGTSAITYYLTRSDNCVSYSVSFNANGGSGTTMANQRIYEDVATPLSTNTYTAPSGKIFKEWNTAADGSGTSYADEESVTNIASVGTTLQLYAIWIDLDFMQDMSFSECSTTPKTVYDKRDNQAYTVAKLADGNCWMLDNLALGSNTAMTLTPNDTNITSNYTLPASGTSNFNSTNGNTNSAINISYKDDVVTSYGDGSGKVGVYYNYCAASAGTVCGDETTIDASSDICPLGWRLPTGTSNGEYAALYSAYSNNATATDAGSLQYNLSTTLSGTFSGTSQSRVNNYGTFWASTYTSICKALGVSGNYAIEGACMQTLQVDPTSLLVDRGVNRYSGQAIRCMKEDSSLYKKVEKMSKGKQTNDTNTTTGIQASIVTPTSSAPISSNSGVYEYNSGIFGEDTDGTKSDGTKAKIYYYRGILDRYGNTGSYGSDGLSDAYPNYVILQTGDSKANTDTCWRIIRTTGSGGVKMIYNGTWTGTTCAHSTTDAQLSENTVYSGSTDDDTIPPQIVRAGYTYNGSYASDSATSSVSVDTVFGNNTVYSGNNVDSIIKGATEKWYNNTISDFNNKIETNAGFCNDRSLFTSSTGETATTTILPYGSSGTADSTRVGYFGAYIRNSTTNKAPSLGCARHIADLYSSDTTKGGNGQLSVPIASITADEASFAGSGSNTATNGSSYNANSFLRNGSSFWSISPYYRYGSRFTIKRTQVYYINADGYLSSGGTNTDYGVRPVISLQEGVAPVSGSGIATDPWVIVKSQEKSYLQDYTSQECAALSVGRIITLYDKRDDEKYFVGKLADGNCWMLDNLRIGSSSSIQLTPENTNIINDFTLPASNTINFDTTNGYTNAAINMSRKNDLPNVYLGNSSTFGKASGKIGGYYNYCAVSAGTYCYPEGSGVDKANTLQDAEYDICPSGWRMPTGGASSEYDALKNSYRSDANATDTDSLEFNLSTPLAGLIQPTGNTEYVGSYGYYWTSTYTSGTNMYHLQVKGSYPDKSDNRYRGHTVRCLKK